MLLVKMLKCMFLIKNLRVYTIGKSSAVFSLRGPLCATFPYMSLPIQRCIDLSNPLRMYRDSIFLKLFVIPGGNALPKKSNGGIFLPPFQIEVGGAKEHPPPLG